jgi:SnoaL-like protein
MTLTAEDSIAILQLVARADTLATTRDADGYVDLFTTDAIMSGAMGTATGREQLGATVARVWAGEPVGTLHLTLNAVIDQDGRDIVVTSVMLMIGPGAAPAVLGAADVRQTVVRTADGWRIAERSISEHELRSSQDTKP